MEKYIPVSGEKIHSVILCSVKLSFRCEGKIKIFSVKRRLGKCVTQTCFTRKSRVPSDLVLFEISPQLSVSLFSNAPSSVKPCLESQSYKLQYPSSHEPDAPPCTMYLLCPLTVLHSIYLMNVSPVRMWTPRGQEFCLLLFCLFFSLLNTSRLARQERWENSGRCEGNKHSSQGCITSGA